jgi:hypothetical protein
LYTAKKYLAAEFEGACVRFLISALAPSNVFEIHAEAEFYELPTLVGAAWTYIEEHGEEVLTARVKDLDLPTLLKVLANEKLKLSEAKLFEYTVT